MWPRGLGCSLSSSFLKALSGPPEQPQSQKTTTGAHLGLSGALKDKSALKMRQGVALGLSSGMVRNGENSSLGSSPTGSCSRGGVSGRLNLKFYGSCSTFPAQMWNFGWWHPTEPALGINAVPKAGTPRSPGKEEQQSLAEMEKGSSSSTAPNPARNLQSKGECSFQAVPAILHQT